MKPIFSSFRNARAAPRIARIASSADLAQIAVTEALLPELEEGGHETLGDAPIVFDDGGRLVPLGRAA